MQDNNQDDSQQKGDKATGVAVQNLLNVATQELKNKLSSIVETGHEKRSSIPESIGGHLAAGDKNILYYIQDKQEALSVALVEQTEALKTKILDVVAQGNQRHHHSEDGKAVEDKQETLSDRIENQTTHLKERLLQDIAQGHQVFKDMDTTIQSYVEKGQEDLTAYFEQQKEITNRVIDERMNALKTTMTQALSQGSDSFSDFKASFQKRFIDTQKETIETLKDKKSAVEQNLNEEIAHLKDQLLRAMAEGQNSRKRAEKERSDLIRYGASGLARDVLDVSDNLRRALGAVDTQAVEALNSMEEGAKSTFKSLIEGVEMTEKMLLSALEKHGVQKVDPKGEKFDYNKHQAVVKVAHEQVPQGHVAEVLQPGYKMHDRLLRPAMVAVSKGKDDKE